MRKRGDLRGVGKAELPELLLSAVYQMNGSSPPLFVHWNFTSHADVCGRACIEADVQ